MTLGHNNPPKEAAAFKEQLESLQERLADWKESTVTGENVTALHEHISEASALKKDADKARAETKEPFLTKGRKIDAEYKPYITGFDDAVKGLKKILTAYLVEQERLKKEAEAKAKAEAEAADRLAMELKDDPLIGADVTSDADEKAAAAKVAARDAEQAGAVASDAGRTVALRTVRYANILQPAVLVGHYASHPDMVALAEKLANAEIRAAKGQPVNIPGIEIVEEQKAA